MKKEGFTLIELLAVIVILAIIALITTPTILGVIQKSKKASSEASALGYIDAVEKYIMTMDISNKDITNGTYKDNELGVDYKGKGPSNALITLEKGIVKEAKLCINKYSFDYDGKEVTNSMNNYCSDNYKVKLVIDDNIEEKSIEKNTSTTFEINNITNKTNIVCNNGATPTIENNTLTISNIFGDTTCKINNNLESTINNIDNTENSIIMVSDEEINKEITIKENKKVSLNLNSKNIIGGFGIIESSLKVYDNFGIGTITCSDAINCFNLAKKALLYTNNINIVSENSLSNGIWFSSGCIDCYGNIEKTNIESKRAAIGIHGNSTNNTIDIYSGYFSGYEYYTLNNNGKNIINIFGGTFVSNSTSPIVTLSNSIINIYQTDTPIYITSLAQTWHPAILNNGTGTINIKANQADNCTNNIEDTTSGLCVYVPDGLGNGSLQNNKDGKVYVDGGTYYGDIQGINNGSGGIININNAYINSNMYAILNHSTGTINVCRSILNGNLKDFYNSSTGTINYSSDVIFTDGTNNPNTYNPNGTVNANYTGTCSY